MSAASTVIRTVRDLPSKLRSRAAYKNTFNTDSGKLVLRDLYLFCRGMQTSHVQGSESETAFNEGKRAVLIRIFHKMKVHDERKMHQQLEEIRDE